MMSRPESTTESAGPATSARHMRLGEILVGHGLITPDQFKHALAAQAGSAKRLGQVLVELGLVSEDDVAWALSTQLGFPYVYLTHDVVDEHAARLLPEAFLRERRVLPILRVGGDVTLAMADPTDQDTVSEVEAQTGLHVHRALALGTNIDATLGWLFSREERRVRPATTSEAQHFQFHLAQAVLQGASEIHFDPTAGDEARVRYRLQGALTNRAHHSAPLHRAILGLLRELTGAGTAPTTGASATMTTGEAEIYLEATFAPTVLGPACTVTLYPRRSAVPDLAPLGIPPQATDLLREAMRRRRGVVLIGCSDRLLRSTLLHAAIPLAYHGKIWTAETLPVYHRPGCNQTALRESREVPAHIRAAASAGADLIVTDDLSDRDAARACFETGRTRLVLAGHEESNLLGLLSQTIEDVGRALVATGLDAVITALGIRLLCPSCKELLADKTFAPRGCEACGFTGFAGQHALVDSWAPDDDVRALLRAGAHAAVFATVAGHIAGRTRAQARALMDDGLTSADEATRALEDAQWTSPIS